MVSRCTARSDSAWAAYGGRGIKVCSRWLELDGQGFANFLEDMGPRPENKSIDRIDGTLGYFPANCRWATYEEQAANRSLLRLIELLRLPLPVHDEPVNAEV